MKDYQEIIQLIEAQDQLIKAQSETISRLVLENYEKDNYIEEIMKGGQ